MPDFRWHETAVSSLHSLLDDAQARRQSPRQLRRKWEEIASLLSESSAAPANRTPAFVGEPTPMSSVQYHLDCLAHVDWTQVGSNAVSPKALYHLRMLGYTLDSANELFQPLVSIVIPVFNGADFIARSLASCTAQTYRKIEVLVVDDGSTDATASIVESFSGPIRILRQENAGPAAARNRGVAAARGDLVHFLDADDELLPEAVQKKLDVLATVPDARLCFSHFEAALAAAPSFSAQAGTQSLGFEQVPHEDDRSALWDPLLAATSRFPFQASTLLIPRWYLLHVGPIDEDLRQSEDTRYWLRMAQSGLKAIALAEPQTRRYRRPESLTGQRIEARKWAIEADLRSAEELLNEPRKYRYLVCLATRMTWILDTAFDEGMPDDQIESLHAKVLDFEARLCAKNGGSEGLVSLLADQLVFMLREKLRHAKDSIRPMLRLWHEREQQLLQRVRDAQPVTGCDLLRWLPDLPPRPFGSLTRSEQVTLKFALEQIQVSLTMGELPIRSRSLEHVASSFPGHPYERYWRSLFHVARILGDAAARTVSRQKFIREGWQLAGRARRILQGRRAG